MTTAAQQLALYLEGDAFSPPEHHQAAAELRRLDAEVQALRKDAERMNWLENQGVAYGFQDLHEGNCWAVDGPFNTAREAIDAAMKGAANG